MRHAADELEGKGIRILRKTKIYKTKPLGDVDQPDFLNQGLWAEVDLPPGKLLIVLKETEAAMGRTTTCRRWGPRLIDIDILFYDRMKVKEPDLEIPHPEFYNRPFARIIAAELAPDFRPPGKKKNLAGFARKVSREGIQIHRD